jgi:hypothetical protein
MYGDPLIPQSRTGDIVVQQSLGNAAQQPVSQWMPQWTLRAGNPSQPAKELPTANLRGGGSD